jgi:DNA-binding transcriptional LysR family regulator
MSAGVTLRQMEAFYWCARLLSFSDAAERLNTSQPAISARIRELEANVGCLLFDRLPRGVRPTAAGQDLLDLAERFVALGDEFAGRARRRRDFGGLIRVGAADSVALTWLPGLVATLSERYPRLGVELVVDLSCNLQQRLADGGIDIAFMVGGLTGPDFSCLTLGQLENAWMCSPLLPLPPGPLSAELLAQVPILTHSRGSHLHRVIEEWFRALGAVPGRVQGCNSLSTLVQLTCAGLGASVLPCALVGAELGAGALRVLDTGAQLPPNVFVACWSNRPPASLASLVAELSVAIVREDPRFQPPRPDRVGAARGAG